jgi:hypothetical protein
MHEISLKNVKQPSWDWSGFIFCYSFCCFYVYVVYHDLDFCKVFTLAALSKLMAANVICCENY